MAGTFQQCLAGDEKALQNAVPAMDGLHFVQPFEDGVELAPPQTFLRTDGHIHPVPNACVLRDDWQGDLEIVDERATIV